MKLEATISNQERARAAVNCLKLLKLPPKSQILIISNELPMEFHRRFSTPSPEIPDPQMTIKREMAAELVDQSKKDYRPMHWEFDSAWSEDELEAKTTVALRQLEGIVDNFQNVNRPTTVIYLGNGSNMSGIHKAIDKVSQSKGEKIRLANFAGFTIEDGRMMSDLTEEQIKKITEAD